MVRKRRRHFFGIVHSELFIGASSKQVQTKVIDNKLKIIDDVPSSAVEMAVKEKVFYQESNFLLTNFSPVPEESPAPGAHCGRG